jgi:DNA-binding transcriptional regulator LsrR (DeoR family)
MKYIHQYQYIVPRLVAYSNTLTQVTALHEALERRFGAPLCGVASSPASNSGARSPRSLRQLLTPTDAEALVAAFHAGVRQQTLADRYGIGLTSVKKLVRLARESTPAE